MYRIFAGLATACLLWCHSASGQMRLDSTAKFLNIGVGFHGPVYQSGSHPAIVASAELAVLPKLTVGVTGSYFRRTLAESHKYSAYSVGLRASYHIRSLKRADKKMDYYAGVGLSYFSFNYPELFHNERQLYVPVHIGVRRLFIKNRLGAFIELGFNDVGFFKVGLSTKL